jgi:predicted ABC-type ATPase
VNADEIAAEIWPDDAENHAKEASQLAAQQRDDYVDDGVSFIAETVFSHASKAELVERAVAAGYEVTLHVVVVTEDLAVARVAQRVVSGGHSVPENKVRERFGRLWDHVGRAAAAAHETIIYDNSSASVAHRRIAVIRTNPASVTTYAPVPPWLPVKLQALLGP